MIMVNRRFPQDSEYSSEPEILPPGRSDFREMESRVRGQVNTDTRSFQRIYVKRVGPLGLLPFFMVTGFIAAVMLVFFLGAFLLLLPVAAIVFAAALFSGVLRGPSRWPR